MHNLFFIPRVAKTLPCCAHTWSHITSWLHGQVGLCGSLHTHIISWEKEWWILITHCYWSRDPTGEFPWRNSWILSPGCWSVILLSRSCWNFLMKSLTSYSRNIYRLRTHEREAVLNIDGWFKGLKTRLWIENFLAHHALKPPAKNQ